MKIKLFIIFTLLVIAALAHASHMHLWQKQNEVHGTGAYGQPAVICTWVCKSDYRNPHTTQTQGRSFCPRPM